jgi:hypothetical protein
MIRDHGQNQFGNAVVLALLIFGASLSCFAQTSYYVDPDYTGGTRDGTAPKPWLSLSDTITNTPWAVINTALASGPVTVYFSARKAGSDTNQTSSVPIEINRTDTSTNRLTLDGSSQYNTNVSAPSWRNYSGSSKFHINASGPDPAIDSNNIGTSIQRNYLTIHGFLLTTQGQIAVVEGMSYLIFENNELYTIPPATIGPGLIIGQSSNLNTVGASNWGHHIIIQNNVIHNTFGEGIYVNGTTADPPGLGIPRQTGDDILITNNTLYDCGANGTAGGACIDVKDGNTNLRIIHNNIYYSAGYTGPVAEQCQGMFLESGTLVDSNFEWSLATPAGGCKASIIIVGAWNNPVAKSGLTIRNNTLIGSGNTAGIKTSPATPEWQFVNIENNTIYNNTEGIDISNANALSVEVRNNIVINSTDLDFDIEPDGGTFTLIHDYNDYWRSTGDIIIVSGSGNYVGSTLKQYEGHSLNVDPRFVSTGTPYLDTNFKLQASSPLRISGGTLPGFSVDYFGVSRPSGAWSLGAAQYVNDTAAPTPGNSGTITTSNVTSTSITLNWTKATDPDDAQNTLTYQVFLSTSRNISNIANAEDNATIILGTTTDIATFNVTGLASDTTYYFNVLVADKAGNQTAYVMSQTTTEMSQTISFAALGNKTFGDADFTVSATASSGLMVGFTASGRCTVSGSTVHLTGLGSCTITASQAGNSNYDQATPVSQTFTISVGGAGGLTTPPPPLPTNVTAISGTLQSTTVNTAFAGTLQVAVRDQYGRPFINGTVRFTAPVSGASLSVVSSTSTTDGNGIASLAAKANTVAGNYEVTASTDWSSPAIFFLENDSGPPATITPTGETSQTAHVRAMFASPVQATVHDAFNNVVAGVPVTFTVIRKSNAAATFPMGNTAVTDDAGQASVGVQANIASGSYTVSATSGAATPASLTLTNADPHSLVMPALSSGQANQVGIALTNASTNTAVVTLTARHYNGQVITGDGFQNPVQLSIPGQSRISRLATEIFGGGIAGQSGWIQLDGTDTLTGSFQLCDNAFQKCDGGALVGSPASRLLFPQVNKDTILHVVNIGNQPIRTGVSVYDNKGNLRGSTIVSIDAHAGWSGSITDLLPFLDAIEGYATIDTSAGPFPSSYQALVGMASFSHGGDNAIVLALDDFARIRSGYAVLAASGGEYSSRLKLINPDSVEQQVKLAFNNTTVQRTIPAHGRLDESLDQMFGLTNNSVIADSLSLQTPTGTAGVEGFVELSASNGTVLTTEPIVGEAEKAMFFSQAIPTGNYWMGLALLSTDQASVPVRIELDSPTGNVIAFTTVTLQPGRPFTELFSELFSGIQVPLGGSMRFTASVPIHSLFLLGTAGRDSGNFLAQIPPILD